MKPIKQTISLRTVTLSGLIFTLTLICFPLLSHAHFAEKGGLQVIHPWLDEGKKAGKTTAHLTFSNNDERKSYTIIGASSEVASSVEFLMDGKGVEKIVVNSGDIFNDEDITVNLIGLNQDLKTGDVTSMTLYFSDNTELTFKLGVGQETMPE